MENQSFTTKQIVTAVSSFNRVWIFSEIQFKFNRCTESCIDMYVIAEIREILDLQQRERFWSRTIYSSDQDIQPRVFCGLRLGNEKRFEENGYRSK